MTIKLFISLLITSITGFIGGYITGKSKRKEEKHLKEVENDNKIQ